MLRRIALRAGAGLALAAAALSLMAGGGIVLLRALYLALLPPLGPLGATLALAGALVLAGLLALTAAYLILRPRRRAAPGDDLPEWLAGHPVKAVAGAAGLGFLLGASPAARRVLRDLLFRP